MKKFTFVTLSKRGNPKRVTVVYANNATVAVKKVVGKYPHLRDWLMPANWQNGRNDFMNEIEVEEIY